MLVKKIHRVWINKDHDIPYGIYKRKWIDSWNVFHPEWTFHFWDNRSSREFLEDGYPWFLPVYDAYPKDINRADAVRYFLMHRLGGLYVDLDMECFKPVDELFRTKTICLTSKNPDDDHFPTPRVRNLVNSVMYSQPGHGFWRHAIKFLMASRAQTSVMTRTGPYMLTNAYLDYVRHKENDISLLDPSLFLPYLSDLSAGLLGNNTKVSELNDKGADYFPDSYAAHRWVSYW